MEPLYEHMEKYTIVLTPHALHARETRFADVISIKDIIEAVDGVRHRMHPNRVSGTVIVISGVKRANLYMRRIFNGVRKREEIEVISLTSCDFFKTHGHNEHGESHMETVWIQPRRVARNIEDA